MVTPNAFSVSARHVGPLSTRPSERCTVTSWASPSSLASVCPSGVESSIESCGPSWLHVNAPATAASPRRADIRPPIENGASTAVIGACVIAGGGSVAQAARTPAKTATAKRFTASRSRGRSRRESLHGLLQHRVIRIGAELRFPERHGLVALALAPQDFAKMRGDLGIRPSVERLLQVTLRLVEMAHPIERPTEAVENERILRRDLVRALDEGEPFVGARRAVDERIPERVERLRIVGTKLDQMLELGLGFVDLVELLRDHGEIVDEVGRVRIVDEALLEHAIRAGVVACLAQELRLGLLQLHLLVLRHRIEPGEPALSFRDVALLAVQRADAQFREPRAVPIGHRAVMPDRLRPLPRFLVGLRKIKIDDARLPVAGGLQLLQQPLGFRIILHRQRDRRDGELEIARSRLAVPQLLHE